MASKYYAFEFTANFGGANRIRLGKIEFFDPGNNVLTPIAAVYCSGYTGSSCGSEPSALIDGGSTNYWCDKNFAPGSTKVRIQFSSPVTVGKYRVYQDNVLLTYGRVASAWRLKQKPASDGDTNSAVCSTYTNQIHEVSGLSSHP